MSDRWTCPVCSTRNHGVNYACQKCGQVRGLEADQTGEAPFGAAPAGVGYAPPSPKKQSGLRWLKWWWAPIVVFGAISMFSSNNTVSRDADGAIVGSATMPVHDLRAGDCFDFRSGEAEEDEIASVIGKNCSLLHDFEVYLIRALDPGPYPNDSQFDLIFDDVCLGGFDDYVGSRWETSEVWADMLWPTEGGWTGGDREIMCYLFVLEGQTVGTFRNSGR